MQFITCAINTTKSTLFTISVLGSFSCMASLQTVGHPLPSPLYSFSCFHCLHIGHLLDGPDHPSYCDILHPYRALRERDSHHNYNMLHLTTTYLFLQQTLATCPTFFTIVTLQWLLYISLTQVLHKMGEPRHQTTLKPSVYHLF